MTVCAGKTRKGPCRYKAVSPAEAPRWCGNCDPSEQAVQRRAEAGRTRHRRYARAASVDQTDQTLIVKPQEPTIDYVVDLALAAAHRVAGGQLTGEQGRAMKLLYQVAIEGMKARGSVGDARSAGPTLPPGANTPAKDPGGQATPPAPDTDSLDELSRQLDA